MSTTENSHDKEIDQFESTVCQPCFLDLKNPEALRIHVSLCHLESPTIESQPRLTRFEKIKNLARLDCSNLPLTSFTVKDQSPGLNQITGKSFNYTSYFFKHRKEALQQLRQKSLKLMQRLRESVSNSPKPIRSGSLRRALTYGRGHSSTCFLCGHEVCESCAYDLSVISFQSIHAEFSRSSTVVSPLRSPICSPKLSFLRSVNRSPINSMNDLTSHLKLCSNCYSLVRLEEIRTSSNYAEKELVPIVSMYNQLYAMLCLMDYLATNHKSLCHAFAADQTSDLERRVKESKQKISELCSDIAVISGRIEGLNKCNGEFLTPRVIVLQKNIRLYALKFIAEISTRIAEAKTELPPNEDVKIVEEQDMGSKKLTIAHQPVNKWLSLQMFCTRSH